MNAFVSISSPGRIKERIKPPRRAPYENIEWISGGTFLMGSNDHYPDWRRPLGPGSSLKKGMSRHPVVHIAYEDAEAYAKRAGKELRLPFIHSVTRQSD